MIVSKDAMWQVGKFVDDIIELSQFQLQSSYAEHGNLGHIKYSDVRKLNPQNLSFSFNYMDFFTTNNKFYCKMIVFIKQLCENLNTKFGNIFPTKCFQTMVYVRFNDVTRPTSLPMANNLDFLIQ